MTHKAAVFISRRLLMDELIKPQFMEEYVYAMETMINRVLTYFSLILLGIFFHQIVPTIIFMAYFFVLRGRTGGFHAPTFFRCYIGTIACYCMLVEIVYPYFSAHMTGLYAGLGVSATVIMLLGSINHPNVNWDRYEFLENKKIARIIVAVQMVIIGIFGCLKINNACIIFPSFSIMLCALLMCMSKIYGQEEKGNEQNE